MPSTRHLFLLFLYSSLMVFVLVQAGLAFDALDKDPFYVAITLILGMIHTGIGLGTVVVLLDKK